MEKGHYSVLRVSQLSQIDNFSIEQQKESIETHEIHMELMDLLKQINVYSGEIAKTIHALGGLDLD